MTTSPSTQRITPSVLEHLKTWEGRSESLTVTASEEQSIGLHALFDLEPTGGKGSPLLPLSHWMYLLPRVPQRLLGADGHPRTGSFMPPVPLPRRMWAGSRLEWQQELKVGQVLRRDATIQSVSHRSGRTGELIFVTLQHQIFADGELALVEDQDIVYRDEAGAASAKGPEAAPSGTPETGTWNREITPDPVFLFRYSALTFNAHRVHYDREYAAGVEGYPGLVVHGPLTATLLADMARREMPGRRLERFSFRAMRPAFDQRPLTLCGTPLPGDSSVRLWARDHEGFVVMQAEAHYA